MINETTTIIMVIFIMIGAAKKASVFGQMTLTGTRALDWLKDGQKIEIDMIEMGAPEAFQEDWNLPDWLSAKWIAIVHPTETWMNPVLVTQMSVLRWLENQCLSWEDTIGTAKGIKRNKKPVCQMFFKKEKPAVEFSRQNKTKFAPYECKICSREK
jgi:hypothetical protein